MTAVPISVWLVRGAQRPPLGAYGPPFKSAAREAMRAHKTSLRRLELDGWAIEDEFGSWAQLSGLTRERAQRTAPSLAFDF